MRKYKPMTDMLPEHEVSYYSRIEAPQAWFENQGIFLVGELDNQYDFFFWSSPYIIKGPPGNYNMVEDGLVLQTMFWLVPFERRGTMYDNEYIQGEWNPPQYLKGSDLTITKVTDGYIWTVKGLEFYSHPPYWESKGSHLGVERNIKTWGIAPGFWYMGKFEDLNKHLSAGVDQYVEGEGTITYKGKTYTITRAYGLHEHLTLAGGAWDQIKRNLTTKPRGLGYLWIVGGTDNMQFFTFDQPSDNTLFGRVIVNGKVIVYEGPDQMTVDEVDWWEDPRTGIVTCAVWHINMRSPQGVIDVMVRNHSRCFYMYAKSNGYLSRYWTLGLAEGIFVHPDGRSVHIKNMHVGTDRGRTIMNW